MMKKGDTTMSMIPFECPNCGASLGVAEGKRHIRCGWCNSDLLLTPDGDGVKATINVNVNVDIKRDEARIKEADVADKANKRSSDIESFKEKSKIVIPVVIMILGGIMFLVCYILDTMFGLEEVSHLTFWGGMIAVYGFIALMSLLGGDHRKK